MRLSIRIAAALLAALFSGPLAAQIGGGGGGSTGSGSFLNGSSPALVQYLGASSTSVGPATIGGDAVLAPGGALTVSASGGTPFGAMAFQAPSAVAITGGTASGLTITNLPSCVNPGDSCPKSYIDATQANGNPHAPVAYVTAAVLPNAPTYNNGAGTLTDGSTGSVLVVAGQNVTSLTTRVLVSQQASGFQNGIYTLTTAGVSGTTKWVLTRAADFNTVTAGNIATGANTFVSAAAYGLTPGTSDGTSWAMNTTGTITLGSTSLNWVQINNLTTYTAAAPINLVGGAFGFAAVPATSVPANTTGGSATPSGSIAYGTTGNNKLLETGAGGLIAASVLPASAAAALGGVNSFTCAAHQVTNTLSTGGAFACVQLAAADLANIASNTVLGNATGSSAAPAALTTAQLTALCNVATSSLSGCTPALSGILGTYYNGTGGWSQGTAAPTLQACTAQTASYTLHYGSGSVCTSGTDANGIIPFAPTAAGVVATLPQSTAGVFPAGTGATVANQSAAYAITVCLGIGAGWSTASPTPTASNANCASTGLGVTLQPSQVLQVVADASNKWLAILTTGPLTGGPISGSYTGTPAFPNYPGKGLFVQGGGWGDPTGLNAAGLTAVVADMKALGVNVVRWTMPIDSYDPNCTGLGSLTAFDAAVSAFHAANISIMLNFLYAAPCMNGGSSTHTDGPTTSAQRTAWVNAIKLIVQRYGSQGSGGTAGTAGSVEYWGIWNEPNCAAFWTGSGGTTGADHASYAALATAAYPVIKAADPQATVLVGEFSHCGDSSTTINPQLFLADLFADGIAAGTSYDGISDHPYCGFAGPYPSDGCNNQKESYNNTTYPGTGTTCLPGGTPTTCTYRSIMAQGGDTTSLVWWTESGEDVGTCGTCVTAAVQAQDIAQYYNLSSTNYNKWAGPFAIWYNYVNNTSSNTCSSNYTYGCTGIELYNATANGTPKASWKAMQAPTPASIGTAIPASAANDVAAVGNLGETITTKCLSSSQTATITIASPAVVTVAASPSIGCPINFTTTGALPTGLSTATNYFIIAAGYSATTFELATTPTGSAINTSGSQSGTQTAVDTFLMTSTSAQTWAALNLTAGNWNCFGNIVIAEGSTSTAIAGAISGNINSINASVTSYFSSAAAYTTGVTEAWGYPMMQILTNGIEIYASIQHTFAGSDSAQGSIVCERFR